MRSNYGKYAKKAAPYHTDIGSDRLAQEKSLDRIAQKQRLRKRHQSMSKKDILHLTLRSSVAGRAKAAPVSLAHPARESR